MSAPLTIAHCINHFFGGLRGAEEKELRRKLVEKALKALETPIAGQTVF